MQYRAFAMTQVFQAQSKGCGLVGLMEADPGYNETFASWLAMDLQNLGYEVIHTDLFKIGLIVAWERNTWGPFLLPEIEELDQDSDDDMETDEEY